MKGGIHLDLTGDYLERLAEGYMVWRSTGALVVIDRRASVPEDTIVWHFARILAFAQIGIDVSIGACSEIGRAAVVGPRSRISAHVFLPPNAVVGSGVFIGPGATFTDDRYPRVLDPGQRYDPHPPVIEDGASIGAGAVILPGVRIGARALIGAGSVVTRDVPPGVTVAGWHARATERPGVAASQVPSLPPIGSGRSTTTSP